MGLIAIGGGTGTGKSTLSTALGESLKAPVSSFSKIIKKEAIARDLPADNRDVLIEIGQSWVDSDPEGLCLAVLNDVDWSNNTIAIIEGFRHVSVLQAMRKLVGAPNVVFVWLEAGEDVRKARLKQRGDNVTAETLGTQDTKTTEVAVHDGSLQTEADISIDASKPFEEVLCQVLAEVNS